MKKQIPMLLVLLASLVSAHAHAEDFSTSYSYAKNFTNMHGALPPSMSIDPELLVRKIFPDKNLVYLSYTLFPAKFCEDTSDYICFSSIRAGMHFAIPRKIDLSRPTWTYDDVNYSIRTGIRRIKILGKLLDVIEIVGESDRGTEHFLFSTKAGLVAFGNLSPGDQGFGSMYWLESSTGFGAEKVEIIGQFDSRPEDLKKPKLDIDQIQRGD